MKIMSLNVNQFLVLRLAEGSWIKRIIEEVKDFLHDNLDGVVFLYEIPKRFFFRSSEIKETFKPYKVIKPHAQGRGNGFTIAIINNQCECGWTQVPQKSAYCVSYWQNRYIELKHSSGLRVLAIHAPGKFEFLQDLSDYAQKFRDDSDGSRNENLIILGDFNIATDEWRTKGKKEELKKAIHAGNKQKIEACEDFFNRQNWLLNTMYQIGYNRIKMDTPTYFWESMTNEGTWEKKSTTIDHVLVPFALQNKITVQIFPPQKGHELSDHAVIIVDVDL